ncbi:CPSF A subunit region-domain-containing protein [Lentinula aff. detonsa]|uniref:CPSF A subunit region-domain-containing protein n=1 Tax=Lentinula aff. detonsa TaxID=2804958 RepID=A0AA38K9N4_9AGAR|nr:CPSF A subunit region-domain-containing protein [Lentinula aff. detonsa]
MHALHQEILAPSGVELAAWVKLTANEGVQSNLVVARSNLLRIFEVREEKFYHIRTHRLHGVVTGLEGVKVLGSLEDGRDRLLVGFKDAKIALLEWTDALHDFTTVSIHTYERAPQCLDIKPSFHSLLRVDPISRCAALLLPQDALAVLPFHQHEELIHPTQGDQMDVDAEGDNRSGIPYHPSYILDLPQSVSSSIHNVVDFVFLPGFHNPTIAVLFNERPTWTGRLEEAKDTCGLIIFSMANSFSPWGGMSSTSTVITNIANLPYDAYALVPCTAGVAGLIILTPNSVIFIDQATKKLMLPVNGWATRVSDVAVVPVSAEAQTQDLALEGSRATFISETTLLLILADGDVYTVMLAMDGKTVSGLSISDKPLVKTTVPSLVMSVNASPSVGADSDGIPCIFVGSTQGPSVILKANVTEEDDTDVEMNDSKDAKVTAGVVDDDIYDDADIYGPSHTSAPDAKKEVRQRDEKKRKLKLQLSLADYLPAYGGINDMVFGLTRNGDKPVPILVAATSTSHHGGFTLFQKDLPVKITKKRMHILGGTKGLWSFALQKKTEKGSGSGGGSSNGERDTKETMIIISTDANPNPGFSRITIPPSMSSKPSIANISNSDIIARIQGTSIGAGPFFGGMVVLQVMTGSIRVLESDGTERQVIKDVESSSFSNVSTARARIRACSISDPYVLILREDDTMGLFIGEASKGKLRRKDMSMLGGKTSKYLTGCFFTDHTGMLEKNVSSPNSKTDLGPRLTNGLNNQWLLLVRPQGVLEIWTLPKMALAFSVGTPFATLENVLVDSGEGAASSVPVPAAATTSTSTNSTSGPSATQTAPTMLQNPTQAQDVSMTPVEAEAGEAGAMIQNKEKVEPTDRTKETDIRELGVIDQVFIAPLGETRPELHLFVLLRSGQLAIYQAIPAPLSLHPSASALETLNGTEPASPMLPRSSRLAHLCIAFVKVLSKTFELQNSNITSAGNGSGGVGGIGSTGGGGLADQKKITRIFIPFRTPTATNTSSFSVSPRQPDKQEENNATTYSGVFFTGENPSWIISTDRGGVHLYPSGHAVVHAFTACPILASKDSRGGSGGEFLIYSDEGPTLLEWIPDFELNFPLPMRSVPRGRAYSNVVFDPSTSLVVAAAVLEARFASFDEDYNRIWAPDAPNISDPTTECSTLELISPDLWVSLDGYEFATNEVVNAVTCVTLETASTETGSKEFIAVGTTINRGEDLAAKGATYIFEIVEVVADPNLAPNRWYKLRLRCRDDAKGPVTALCGLNGYLVSSMGQKIFVRAFDSDERLVGVAFMDVGVYVTSLRTIKNLLLIGDAVKNVSFVAFQEDPYKLILLAKDPRHLCITTADFFFADNEMAIFTHDEEGILRLYDYNPLDPESSDGRYLLLRSEFNSQATYLTTALIAQRTNVDTVIPQARLLCGATNGSIATITPVEESAAKRLQLLQGQLTRNVQHIAGLNPRALRIVRNDYVSKPLSKSVLDANLLVHFENSSITKQIEMTKQIGTEVAIVRQDWMALAGPW